MSNIGSDISKTEADIKAAATGWKVGPVWLAIAAAVGVMARQAALWIWGV